jgi:hypothetical protein
MTKNKLHKATDSYHIEMGMWLRGRNAIVFIALVSWIACLAGYFANPQRFFESYLVGFLVCVTVPLGAMFFMMVQFLTGSAWSVPMRRIGENLMVTIATGALLFIPIALGLNYLYIWTDRALVAKDAVLNAKGTYLSPMWFIIRAAVYFFVWWLLSSRIYKNSTDQDKTGSLENMHRASRWSAPGLLLTTLTVSLAAWDWSMSLDPHWYSTIFGLYVFAGGGLAFMAVWTLICLALREKGVLRNTINVEHYHDLGKWMFALTVFWAYIAFSQYLLIWYANLPEETIWFRHRMQGTWGGWSLLLLFGQFIIPFLVLLPRASKRNFKVLTGIALWILCAHFVDLYWQVMPTFHLQGVAFHWLDVSCLAAVGSIFALAFWFRVKRHALLPVGDPRFEQGLHFENI